MTGSPERKRIIRLWSDDYQWRLTKIRGRQKEWLQEWEVCLKRRHYHHFVQPDPFEQSGQHFWLLWLSRGLAFSPSIPLKQILLRLSLNDWQHFKYVYEVMKWWTDQMSSVYKQESRVWHVISRGSVATISSMCVKVNQLASTIWIIP